VQDEDGFGILEEYWRYDCNPPDYRFDSEGGERRYATRPGPSECIGTAVFHNGKVYAVIGQDPEHGEGVGAINCIDATGDGDITETGRVWRNTEIERSISTPSIYNGLCFVADYSGRVHCYDALSGEHLWTHDTLGHIWGSTLAVDGKVFIGNEDGYLTVLAASREKNVLHEIEMGNAVYSSALVANNVLYIATQSHLYAVEAE
jgi:outer membrane protein assembly factor BamB